MKNKNRAQVAKMIRMNEIVSSAILLVMAIFVIYLHLGNQGIIVALLIYFGITVYSYTLIRKCRCEHCGSTDVFNRRMGFTLGIDNHCHHCGKKININKPIKEIHYQGRKK